MSATPCNGALVVDEDDENVEAEEGADPRLKRVEPVLKSSAIAFVGNTVPLASMIALRAVKRKDFSKRDFLMLVIFVVLRKSHSANDAETIVMFP